MMIDGDSMLKLLAKAPWIVAGRTLGNDHATLIGLLVHWWIIENPAMHTALEGGPGFGHHEKGVGGGQCDALLCDDGHAVGVVEVEGTRLSYTATKLGSFFDAAYEQLARLQFGLLLLYAYTPVGRGHDRRLEPAATPAALDALSAVSAKHATKPIVLITLDKTYERQARDSIRSRNEYYFGCPTKIAGTLFLAGQPIKQQLYWTP